MATIKRQVKLAITNGEEILALMRILNELNQLHKDMQIFSFEDIEFSEYEILQGFERSDPESFLSDLLEHLSEIHHLRILWNCDSLLKNCTDPSSDTLEFHPDIKRGLELLEAQEENQNNPPTKTP